MQTPFSRISKRFAGNLYGSLKSDLPFLITSKPRSEYIGYVGHGNLGDEALFYAIQDIFDKQMQFRMHNSRSRLLELLEPAFKVKVSFLGGGTLIKKGEESYLGKLKRSLKTHPKTRLVVFGTGVADPKLWHQFGLPVDIEGWSRMLNRSDFLAVRGPISEKFLHDWGVEREIHIIGDPALWFGKDGFDLKQRTKRIGINFGPSAGRIFGQDEEKVVNFGADLLRHLRDRGWTITLFPVVQDDLPYLRSITSRAGIESIQIHYQFLDIPLTLKRMEEQDLFIGEKLHSVVLASCVYTPAIMLAYRTKCYDFMCSIECSDSTFFTDKLDLMQILGRLDYLYDSIELQQAHLFEQVQKYQRKLRWASEEVLRIVSDDSQ